MGEMITPQFPINTEVSTKIGIRGGLISIEHDRYLPFAFAFKTESNTSVSIIGKEGEYEVFLQNEKEEKRRKCVTIYECFLYVAHVCEKEAL